jgi:putative serine protease PepD
MTDNHTPHEPPADGEAPHPESSDRTRVTPQVTRFDEPHEAPLASSYDAPPPPLSPPVVPPRRRALGPIVVALTLGAIIGGAIGGGMAIWAVDSQGDLTPLGEAPASITVNNPDEATVVTAVVAKAMPSVVTIEVSGTGAQGSGSGVILSDDGYVLTNAHVATLDGAATDPRIRVTTADGRLWNATLVGADPVADLAVIRLEGATGLQPIEFADSDALNVGDRAVAIGAPLGLKGTVTDGIISALNRSITVRSAAMPGAPESPMPEESPFEFWNFDLPGRSAPGSSTMISLAVIQTDAAINPGNSGGALLDSRGRLIGINVAIATAGGQGSAGSIGVGFSIPANFAQRIASELIETGTATHGLLGATVSDASQSRSSRVVGALIDSVSRGGPAERAGLRSGDIITSFNGIPITDQVDLTAQVRVRGAGETVDLVYVRDDSRSTLTVTLGKLP